MHINTVIEVEDLLLHLRIRRWLSDFDEIRMPEKGDPEQKDLFILDHIPNLPSTDSEWILIVETLDQSMIQNTSLFSAFDVIIGGEEDERFRYSINAFLHWRKTREHLLCFNQETMDQVRRRRMEWIRNIEEENAGYDQNLISAICSCLQEHTDHWWTVAELAILLDASKTTLRKYMEELERRNRVQFRMRYGKGRPSREYTIKSNTAWKKVKL